jgi:hypothetical protein
MTISNGNGKSRTNGNGKKSGALVTETPLENLPTVDELLVPPSQQDHQPQQPETQTEQQSAEELLRQAKQQTRTKAEPTPEPEPQAEQSGELVSSATQEIGSAIAQGGQNLVDAQQISQQEIITAGAEDGINDADAYAASYQANFLNRVSQHKLINAQTFRQQMNLVRQHGDAQNGDLVQQSLKKVEANIKPQGESTDPLGEIALQRSQGVTGIQLFPKK